MKKTLLLLALIIFIIASSTGYSLAEGTNNISTELDAALNTIVEEGKSKGAILSIVKDGKILFSKGYGYADEYHGFKADAEKTAFRIGSVSKTFVAVAAQLLQQKGLLDMNCDISAYLEPNFPKLAYPVTMQQLLTHTAGFEDLITGMVVFNESDTEPLSESLRKYMPQQVSQPGQVVSYSNYGVALAAYVIQQLSNQDFALFCQEEIFQPLGMNRTTFLYMHDIAYVSKAYLPNGRETLEPFINIYPEGSAVSTAEDMAKYMLWLMDSEDTRVLLKDSKEALFAKHFSMSEELEGVGYVWNRKTRNGLLYFDKKGETLNFYTRIALYPQKQTGIFLSFNTYVPEVEINGIMSKVTDLLYGENTLSNKGIGNKTIDIEGSYINNWSSFKTTEKLLSYFSPGKILKIKKLQDGGYSVNGKDLRLVGDDFYFSPMEHLKFIEWNGKTVIATEGAITYTRLSPWQSKILQLLAPILFLVVAFISSVWKLLLVMSKHRSKITVILFFTSVIQIIFFTLLCILVYNGIAAFSLLSYSFPMKLCGWIIAAAGFMAAVALGTYGLAPGTYRIVEAIWIAVSLLFTLWLFNMHIL